MERRRTPIRVVLALAALVLVACGGGSGHEEWRGLELQLPDGWEVFEDGPGAFSVADGPLGEEAGEIGERSVAAFFSHEQGASPDDWRRFVEEQDAALERDEQLLLDGVPATLLQFSYTTNGIPLREMVVVVPSREVVILMQPVVRKGDTHGPELFLEHLEEFQALLGSIDFGAPVEG